MSEKTLVFVFVGTSIVISEEWKKYIFEDCDEKHVTKNTYEWCADGIVPEIHE